MELLDMVLLDLDLRTLTDFRRLNKLAMQVVDSLPPYKKIFQHAPSTLRGSLSIGTARSITCPDLYEKLCTAECDCCGEDSGGYLYLVTFRRVCFFCFTEEQSFLPLLRSDVARKFALPFSEVAKLPSMMTIPGRYSRAKDPRGSKCYKRVVLVDNDAGLRAGIALHGDYYTMSKRARDMMDIKLQAYQDRLEASKKRDYLGEPRPPKTVDGIDGYSVNPKRFMGVVRVPVLDPRNGSPLLSALCQCCRRIM